MAMHGNSNARGSPIGDVTGVSIRRCSYILDLCFLCVVASEDRTATSLDVITFVPSIALKRKHKMSVIVVYLAVSLIVYKHC
jgi:hypothetical protein